ncbi:hypothetical protein Tco_0977484 [Tanacetum coccineum]|uniref:Uncharacterized protein n=1 Tax=Tanacetum coccineum TaxID=301880 RepID=A0ABQ5ELC7_9ASTR
MDDRLPWCHRTTMVGHQVAIEPPWSMSPPDANNTYTKPPSVNQILGFIKTLGYDEDRDTKLTTISKFVATRLHQPWGAILSVLNRSLTGKDSSWDTARLLILQILWGIVHSANLDFASLIWDEFEWQTVDRSTKPSKRYKLLYTHFTKLIINHFLSCNKKIPRRSNSDLHSEQDDHPLTKLTKTVNGDYKFGMEIPDTMLNDAIKMLAGYKYYTAKKAESEKAKIVDEPEEQHVSQVIIAVELAKSISIDKQQNQRQVIRSQLTIERQLEIAVEDTYAEWGQKGKATDSEATQDSSGSDDDEEFNDETDDSDMDLSNHSPQRDDDAIGFGNVSGRQCPSYTIDEVFLALGLLLEEIHVTWAHLEKKRTRLRTYTKSLEDLSMQWLETASQAYSEAVVIYVVTVSGRG